MSCCNDIHLLTKLECVNFVFHTENAYFTSTVTFHALVCSAFNNPCLKLVNVLITHILQSFTRYYFAWQYTLWIIYWQVSHDRCYIWWSTSPWRTPSISIDSSGLSVHTTQHIWPARCRYCHQGCPCPGQSVGSQGTKSFHHVGSTTWGILHTWRLQTINTNVKDMFCQRRSSVPLSAWYERIIWCV